MYNSNTFMEAGHTDLLKKTRVLADPSARLCATRDRNLNCAECGVRVSECNDDVMMISACLHNSPHYTTKFL